MTQTAVTRGIYCTTYRGLLLLYYYTADYSGASKRSRQTCHCDASCDALSSFSWSSSHPFRDLAFPSSHCHRDGVTEATETCHRRRWNRMPPRHLSPPDQLTLPIALRYLICSFSLCSLIKKKKSLCEEVGERKVLDNAASSSFS
eukprot:g80475.t1